MNEPSKITFVRIKTLQPFQGVGLDYPRPESTPGVFIEHFDLSPPIGDGKDGTIYVHLFGAVKEASALAGWAFRSYSSMETPGTQADWDTRQIRHFPTLILFRDGVELGRHTAIFNSVPGILFWGNTLLGIECEAPDRPAITKCLRENTHITAEGLVLSKYPDSHQLRSCTSALSSTPSAACNLTDTMNMNDDSDPDLTTLREELEQHFVSGSPLEVIYFGGGLPGTSRTITPLRYGEKRGRSHIIGLCHRSGIEKTFRLDRMHLPGPPVPAGKNDFRMIAKCVGNARLIEGMLSQIARLGNLPIEEALAAHLEKRGEFASFFDEYPYGGFTLELKITSAVIYLSLGYDANAFEMMHYQFTPESEPRLTPDIATHYFLYIDRPERPL